MAWNFIIGSSLGCQVTFIQAFGQARQDQELCLHNSLDIVGFLFIVPVFVELVYFTRHIPLFFHIERLVNFTKPSFPQ